jgi:type I restriction enzyme S subunit
MSETPSCEASEFSLGKLAKGYRGVSYRPEQLKGSADDSTATLLRATNIQNGSLDFDDVQFVPKSIVSIVQVLREGDLAVCMSNGSKALVGKSAPFRGNQAGTFTVGAFCSIFKPTDAAAHDLLIHLFHSQAYQRAIDVALSGSAINNLKNSDIEAVSLSLPPRAAWQRIAVILTSLDDSIEATEALIEKHRQIKAGLMHELFTRGALSKGGLRPLMSDAPHLYRDGPAGVLPVEWEVATAGSLCSLITKGTTPAATDMWEGDEGIRFLRVDNLTFDGQLSFEASEFRISAHTHASTLARSCCTAGDVLMNIVGPPLGKVGLVLAEDGSININQAIALFRPACRVLSRFLLLWLTTETAKRWILQRGKQTSGQVNVTLAMCQALPVPLPSLEEQGRIVARISASDNSLRSLATRLEKLRAQKLGLMQDLLTGKVAVKVPESASPT